MHIESMTEINDTLGSSRPCGLEEGGAKAIRARTCVGVHVADSIVKFIIGERGTEMIKRERSLKINVIQTEIPGCVMDAPHQIVVEGMQDFSFPSMAVVLATTWSSTWILFCRHLWFA
jgi:hypothetical protein